MRPTEHADETEDAFQTIRGLDADQRLPRGRRARQPSRLPEPCARLVDPPTPSAAAPSCIIPESFTLELAQKDSTLHRRPSTKGKACQPSHSFCCCSFLQDSRHGSAGLDATNIKLYHGHEVLHVHCRGRILQTARTNRCILRMTGGTSWTGRHSQACVPGSMHALLCLQHAILQLAMTTPHVCLHVAIGLPV